MLLQEDAPGADPCRMPAETTGSPGHGHTTSTVARREFLRLLSGAVAVGVAGMAVRPQASRASAAPPSCVTIFGVEAYRQAADADDTDCILRAIVAASLAGGGVVQAAAGSVYRVSPRGSLPSLNPSGATGSYATCIALPSSVTLDMQGSTLQLQGSVQATLVANAVRNGRERDHDVGLVNAVLDGRNVPFSDTSLLHVAYVDRLTLDNVKLINGSYQCAWVYAVANSSFDGLDADQIRGLAWTIGSPQGGGTGSNQVYDSVFGTLTASNVTTLGTFNQPGNSFDLVLTRCSIARIEARRCDGGIKVQFPGRDITIGSVLTEDCGEASMNSGLKLQGDINGGPVRNVDVTDVVARGQAGPGLYLERSENCRIGSYLGEGNARTGRTSDVWLGGTGDAVGSLVSRSAGGAAVHVRSYASGFSVEKLHASNTGQAAGAPSRAGVSVAGGTGTFGQVSISDDQRPATMTDGVDIYAADARIAIASLDVTGGTGVGIHSMAPAVGTTLFGATTTRWFA